jgi:hypothetical protein
MDRALESLRQRYIALQRDYLQVATECRDMDALLKDMRSALFNLRVAIQSFEDYEISPLSETTNILNQYKGRLRECSDEATCKSLSPMFFFLLVSFHFMTFSSMFSFSITAEVFAVSGNSTYSNDNNSNYRGLSHGRLVLLSSLLLN